MSGKKMKKISVVFLTTILLLVFSATQISAANLSFTDVTASRYDWVRPYIEKMYLAEVVRGTSTTTYGPDAAVTREDLITMLVRLMGWESQASGKTLPPNFSKPNSVAPYARANVAMAIEKGMLSSKDLEDFRPADAAKRSEVAVFAVRALGLGAEAESRKNVSISLSFTDGYMIEPGDRPYIEIAIEKGIMKGFPDNSFKPNDKFTRAQMATVLHNLSKLTKVNNIISGEVQDVDSSLLPSIHIKLADNTDITYYVKNSTSIYKEDANGSLQKIQLNNINVGDTVNVIVNGYDALYIDVTSDLQASVPGSETIEGTITEINTLQSILTIKDNSNKEKSYYIKNQTLIYIGDMKATLYDLVEGQSVKITISGNDVEKVVAKGIDKVVEGIIRAVNITNNTLTIENKDNDKYESYAITSGTRVYRDDRLSDIYQLKIGDVATITVSNSRIDRIEAESAEKEVEGFITNIDFASRNPVITIEDDDGDETEYELDKDATIRKNGKRANISDLKNGDEVVLTLEYNVAVRVVAESVKRDVSGTVKAITFADTNSVTIIDDNGKEHTVTITRDTDIRKDRKRIEVTELRTNHYLDIEMENNEAISIDVTVKSVKDTIRGTVVNVNDDVKVIVVDVKNDDGTRETRHVYYTKDTLIYKENREVRISRIQEGDEVLAIGSFESGLFFADTIHDLTIEE